MRRYDAFHLLEETEAAGYTTYFTYDGAGRLICEEKEGMKKEYGYDTLGRQNRKKEFYGAEKNQFVVSCKKFDLLDRVVAEWLEGPQGEVFQKTSFIYDPAGRLLETISDQGRSCHRYNAHGDLIEKIDILGNVTRTKYSYPFENTLEITDSLGRRVRKIRDALDRVICEEHFNPLGELLQKIESRYDLSGNRISTHEMKLPTHEQKIIQWEFDAMSRPVACIEAAGTELQRRVETRYDVSGNITESLKADGLILSYRFDQKNRLQALASSDGSVHYRYEYDSADHWIKASDLVNRTLTERAYDAFGRLKREVQGNGLSTSYERDDLGRVTKFTLPDTSCVDYTYEGPCLLRVTRRSKDAQASYEHAYTYGSNLKPIHSKMIGHAGSLQYTYDALDRLSKISSPIFEESIVYDAVGNIVKRSLRNQEKGYTYTDLDQLQAESGPFPHSFAYDALNNQVAKDPQTFSVNSLNHLTDTHETHFEYDQRGNRISKNEVAYHYDALDRLISCTTLDQKITYLYDVEDRVLAKALFNSQGELLHTYRYLYQESQEIGAYDEKNQPLELRVLGLQTKADLGSAIAIELPQKTLVPLHDSLGNLIHLIDSETTLIYESFDYSAFGEEAPHDSKIPWRYASKRYDPETGLIRFGHRFYDPSLSRWLTADPAGFADGLNLYTFCKNNPLRYYDPDGRFVFAIPLVIWGAEGLIIALPTLTQLGCIIGAAALGYGTTKAYTYLSEITDEEVQEEKKGRHRGKDNDPKSTIPKDKSGNYLLDPSAEGCHTTLGERTGRKGSYTQGASFDEEGNFKGRTDVTDHGRPHEHSNPHWHPALGPDRTDHIAHPLPEIVNGNIIW